MKDNTFYKELVDEYKKAYANKMDNLIDVLNDVISTELMYSAKNALNSAEIIINDGVKLFNEVDGETYIEAVYKIFKQCPIYHSNIEIMNAYSYGKEHNDLKIIIKFIF